MNMKISRILTHGSLVLGSISLLLVSAAMAHPLSETHRHTMNYTATAGQDYRVIVSCGEDSYASGGGVSFGPMTGAQATVAAQYITSDHRGYLVVTRRAAAGGNYEVEAYAECSSN